MTGRLTSARALLLFGVVLTLVAIVAFAVGWESAGWRRLLICVPALFASALALFLFAEGWDRFRTLKNSGRVTGRVIWPALPSLLKQDARIALRSQAGQIAAVAKPDADGRFILDNVEDGVWLLEIMSTWTQPVRNELRLQRRETLDLGTVVLKFAESKLWSAERLPIIDHLSSYARDATGAEWVGGFRSHNMKNSRVILRRRDDGTWGERIVPSLAKAERITLIQLLRDGTIVIGSLDAGAAFSRDNGSTWSPMSLPPDTNSISTLLQLPDGSFVAGAWKFRGGYSPPGLVLRYHRIEGEPRVTLRLERERIESFHLTSSGRLLLGGDGENPGIRHSEDYGDSWTLAEMNEQVSSYGEFCGFIEKQGALLTGIRTFAESNVCYRSVNDGLDWAAVQISPEVESIQGFSEVPDGIICLTSTRGFGPLLYFSNTLGQSWTAFMDLVTVPNSGSSIGRMVAVGEQSVILTLNTLATAATPTLTPSHLDAP